MRLARLRLDDGAECHARVDPDGGCRRLEGTIESGFTDSGEPVHGKLLAPLAPCAIYCTGLNYRQHARETGHELPKYPILFLKAPSAVQNPDDPIRLPRHRLRSDCVDYECELAVVIGASCRNVAAADALGYVFGYTCANDVSARDWQGRRGGGQWCRAKVFDTFCPLGPHLVTRDEIPDPNALAIVTRLNGDVVQSCSTSDMIFRVAELIEFFSAETTLPPGTLILTGTPHGVGMAHDPPLWLQPGDRVEIEIERIGTLVNPVVADDSGG